MARRQLTAYVDESQRPGRDLLTLVVPGGPERELRQRLRCLLLRNETQIHFAHESDRRRRQLLSAMGELDAAAVTLIVRLLPGRSGAESRDRLVQAAAVEATRLGASKIVLERRTPEEDHRDRFSIARSKQDLSYRHADPHGEPLLWLPDVIGWCVGRGREWPNRLPAEWRVTQVVGWE